ncbi:MAG: AAA family ATPase [Bacteroidia bacterium]
MKGAEKDILIIRGAPGAGKSQVAKSLSELFPKGIRLEVDTLRSMVISVDWTNQIEHINLLHISSKLAYDFIQSGFSPVIVVDTFSGDKIQKYVTDLYQLDKGLSIKIFGLYATEEELKRRIELRKHEEFRDFKICKRLNEETLKFKHENEYQIDTTGKSPEYIANIIYLRQPG